MIDYRIIQSTYPVQVTGGYEWQFHSTHGHVVLFQVKGFELLSTEKEFSTFILRKYSEVIFTYEELVEATKCEPQVEWSDILGIGSV